MKAVVGGPDRKLAAGDEEKALVGRLVVVCVQSVLPGRQHKASAGDADGVLPFQRVGGGVDHVAAAGDLQIVFGDDAVGGGVHGQRSAAVERQIGLRVDRAVGFGLAVAGEAARYDEAAVRNGRDENLVRTPDVDTGEIAVEDVHAVQHQLYLCVRRVYNDGAFRGAAADDVDALLGDREVFPVADGERFRPAQLRALVQIPLGEKLTRVDKAVACARRHRRGAERGKERREQAGDQHRREDLVFPFALFHELLPSFLLSMVPS